MFEKFKQLKRDKEEIKHYLDKFDPVYKKYFMDVMVPFFDDKEKPFANVGIHNEQQVKIDYDPSIKTIRIAFEDSEGTWDWIHNFWYFKTPCRPYKDMKTVFLTHRGFTVAWKSMDDYVKEQVQKLVNEHPEVEKIWIYGWSYGGAMATFCHEFIGYNFPNIETTTFTIGAPKIMAKIWNPFKRVMVAKRFARCVMIENNNDIVPHCPPRFVGYTRFFPAFKVGDKFNIIKFFNPFKYHLQSEYHRLIQEIADSNK